MIPDRNNVYGMIAAAHGLRPVLRAVERLVGEDGRVSLRRSGFDGSETLRLDMEATDFETTPLGGGEHLLNGGVGGSLEEVLAFVRALSGALSEARIPHRFEVYDEQQQLVQMIPS